MLLGQMLLGQMAWDGVELDVMAGCYMIWRAMR